MSTYWSVPHQDGDYGSEDISTHRSQNESYPLSCFSPRPLVSQPTFGSDTDTLLNDPSSPPTPTSPAISKFNTTKNTTPNANITDFNPSPKPQWFRRLSSATGWRKGLQFSILLTILALALNTALLITALRAGRQHQEGVSMISQAKCSKTKQRSLLLHLGINILSTMLLGASGYTMQILCSPTRRDVDRAHAMGDWLDVGSPGWRNLRSRRIGWKRLVAYGLLMGSSLPLHLLYNSIVITTVASNYVAVALVPENLLTSTLPYILDQSIIPGAPGAPRNDNNRITNLIDNFGASPNSWKTSFDNLTWQNCISSYRQNFITDRHDVILVSSEAPISPTNGTKNIIHYGLQLPIHINDGKKTDSISEPYDWIEADASAREWIVQNQTVKYCFSEKVDAHCTVHLHSWLITVIIVCNLVNLACMVWTQLTGTIEEPLVTIGDAVSSFLAESDANTKDMCAMTVFQVLRKRPVSKAWDDTQYHWSAAVPKGFRISFVLCILIFLLPWYSFIAGSLNSFTTSNIDTSLLSLFRIGFGTIHGSFLFTPTDPRIPTSIIGQIILSNSPQAIFSTLYLIYNFFLTRMILAQEWASYAHHHKPLRVSSPLPNSLQRSTYFLQLPYRYSIPLMAFSAVVHWMVSQSFYYVQVRTMVHGVQHVGSQVSFHTIGYSLIAMMFTAVFGLVMVVTLWVVGRGNRYLAGIPFARTCSMVVAAACHAGEKGEEVRRGLVRWGVVPGGGEKGVRHCTFSNGEVETPIEGEEYAGEGDKIER